MKSEVVGVALFVNETKAQYAQKVKKWKKTSYLEN